MSKVELCDAIPASFFAEQVNIPAWSASTEPIVNKLVLAPIGIIEIPLRDDIGLSFNVHIISNGKSPLLT